MAEGLVLASGAKTAVAEYYDSKGSFPTGCSGVWTSCNAEVGLADFLTITGKYVHHVAIGASDGIITLQWSGVEFLSIAIFVPPGTLTATREAQMNIPDGALLAIPLR